MAMIETAIEIASMNIWTRIGTIIPATTFATHTAMTGLDKAGKSLPPSADINCHFEGSIASLV
jgi:hypothetical protein